MTYTSVVTARGALRVGVAAASVLALVVPASAGIAMTPAGDSARHARLVTAFGPRDSSFAESLAVDSHGGIYVSKTVWGDTSNTGRLLRVRPSGRSEPFGPRLTLGATGMLLGVSVSGRDQVYVARYDFGGTARSVILRVTAHGARAVATFPAGAWPNGLAFHGGRLYVTDSALGDVWRFRPSAGLRDLTVPWLHSPLLAPAPKQDLGVNGLAFWGKQLFLVNYTRNSLVSVRLGRHDEAGQPQRVVRLARLHTADGIAFDRRGRLWVTVNGTGKPGQPLHGQYLLRLSRTGRVQLAVKDAPWMNYPTMIAPGRTRVTAHRMFVTDGAFNGGTPDLRSFRML